MARHRLLLSRRALLPRKTEIAWGAAPLCRRWRGRLRMIEWSSVGMQSSIHELLINVRHWSSVYRCRAACDARLDGVTGCIIFIATEASDNDGRQWADTWCCCKLLKSCPVSSGLQRGVVTNAFQLRHLDFIAGAENRNRGFFAET